jgi:hypothetical protein
MRLINPIPALCLFLVIYLSSCTHSVHQYQVGDQVLPSAGETKEAKRVRASASQFTILGFVTNTDYINHAWNKLQSLCPEGTLSGINTRYSTSHGFFYWTNEVKMTAYCR